MYFRKISSGVSLVAIALLWLIPSTVRSEISYKIPTGFGWRVGLPLHLLELEAVQKDLGLTAEASYKLHQWKVAVTGATMVGKVAVADRVKLRGTYQRAESKFQPDLDLILTHTQQERLHEIDLQLEGLDALSDEAVAKALELTPQQSAAIRDIHQRMRKDEMDAIKGVRKAGNLSLNRDQLLLDVLKPAQHEKFAQIKGSNFDRSGFLPYLRLKDRELEIWNVSFSPNGNRIASSRQNDIFIWDAENGELISQMHGHAGNVTSLCFGPDGRWLISSSTDRTVKSWEVETGRNVLSHGERDTAHNGRFIPGLGSDCYRSIALSPDATRLAHANGTMVSIANNIDPLTPPFFKSSESYPVIVDMLPVWSVAFNSDGKRYACGRIDGSVYLLGFGRPTKINAGAEAVLHVTYSADGQQVATANADGTVKLWNAIDGRAIASLPSHEKPARCVTFNHDASLVASAGEDGIVRVTSAQSSFTPIRVLEHPCSVTAVSFHPKDNRLATTGSDGRVRIWSESGSELFVLNPPSN